jgi:hypothetical protein
VLIVRLRGYVHTRCSIPAALAADSSLALRSKTGPVYRCIGNWGRMLRWAIAWRTTPLTHSALDVWGQGRHGLLEQRAESAYHGSHSSAFEAHNFVLHFVL